MTRYNINPRKHPDWVGDEVDVTEFAMWLGYREGVNRVLEYVESINAYPKLIAELRWAIQEGII